MSTEQKTTLTPETIKRGGRYNWQYQPERLIYVGRCPRKVIDELFGNAAHGTRREDIEVAYAAGEVAAKASASDLLHEVENFLTCCVDSSMSRNNREQLAYELREQVRAARKGA